MTVSVRMTIDGWWSAYNAPSGLVGKPEALEEYAEFKVEDITLYILKSILQSYVKKNTLLISIEGYGKFEFEIME